MEVRRVPHNGRHLGVDVLQHQVVLRLLNSQSSSHVADDEVVAQCYLLVKDRRGRWNKRLGYLKSWLAFASHQNL